MSATFNVLKFAEYFSYPLYGKLVPAPIIDLDKSHDQKTTFMIHEYYLCQMGILQDVSSLHVCKLEWHSVSHCYMRQFYVTWESYWSHLVGGIAREELCVSRCASKHLIPWVQVLQFLQSFFKQDWFFLFFCCFFCFQQCPCLIIMAWKVKVFASQGVSSPLCISNLQ